MNLRLPFLASHDILFTSLKLIGFRFSIYTVMIKFCFFNFNLLSSLVRDLGFNAIKNLLLTHRRLIYLDLDLSSVFIYFILFYFPIISRRLSGQQFQVSEQILVSFGDFTVSHRTLPFPDVILVLLNVSFYTKRDLFGPLSVVIPL